MEIDRDFRDMNDEQILNEFITYYNTNFKDDLEHFFALVPEKSKYHEDQDERFFHAPVAKQSSTVFICSIR